MEYWAYARVSTHKQAHGKTIDEQIRPLKKFLRQHGYNTANSIRNHLFHEQYTGTTMKRPRFRQMMAHVKPGDMLVFAKLSRMSRTLDGADKFIMNVCKPNKIKVHILDGGWNIDPTTPMGRLQMHLFLSFVEFDHDLVIERMNQGRLQAKLNGKKNWNGGIAPRFYGKKKKHYQKVYEYTFDHSEKETATTFDISRRTVDRIKKAGREYYSVHNKKNPNQTELIGKKKPIKISKKLQRKLELRDKLQTENDDLINNSQDLSLLKLTNPPLYRRKHNQQRKAKTNIRKAIRATKKALSKLNK